MTYFAIANCNLILQLKILSTFIVLNVIPVYFKHSVYKIAGFKATFFNLEKFDNKCKTAVNVSSYA